MPNLDRELEKFEIKEKIEGSWITPLSRLMTNIENAGGFSGMAETVQNLSYAMNNIVKMAGKSIQMHQDMSQKTSAICEIMDEFIDPSRELPNIQEIIKQTSISLNEMALKTKEVVGYLDILKKDGKGLEAGTNNLVTRAWEAGREESKVKLRELENKVQLLESTIHSQTRELAQCKSEMNVLETLVEESKLVPYCSKCDTKMTCTDKITVNGIDIKIEGMLMAVCIECGRMVEIKEGQFKVTI